MLPATSNRGAAFPTGGSCPGLFCGAHGGKRLLQSRLRPESQVPTGLGCTKALFLEWLQPVALTPHSQSEIDFLEIEASFSVQTEWLFPELSHTRADLIRKRQITFSSSGLRSHPGCINSVTFSIVLGKLG